RFGSIHRNAYVNSPRALTAHLSTKDDPLLLFAGQLTGVEGYTESAATGILAGINLARLLAGEELLLPPPTTMLGALYHYVHSADPEHFQPMNANFGLLEPLDRPVKAKQKKKELLAARTPKLGRKLPVYLDRVEIDLLFHEAERRAAAGGFREARDLAMLELFYSTGIRLSELAGLNEQDIDLVSDQLKVRGKGKKERIVPVGKHAGRALRRYYRLRDVVLAATGQERRATILSVRCDGQVALGGDGQVRLGNTVMEANANKVRALKGGKVLAGFAGASADAFTLFEKFEEKLERYPGNLPRAAVELAKDWRSDRVLRRLEALLVVADKEHGYVISGSGELIEPDDGILAIGSGGNYALAAGPGPR